MSAEPIFENLVIAATDTLKDALRRMTLNRIGVVFVCDENFHLQGTLSDGDVRRSLLNDTLLIAPVSKAMNLDPVATRSVAEAVEQLRKYSLVAVPVVDESGCITRFVVEDPGGGRVIERSQPAEGTAAPVEMSQAVAIIPARGGSKRLPRKNLAMVGGRTLVGWAVLAAKSAAHVGPVIVSTDDDEIAEAVRALGVEVPWLRPAELARDDTATLAVVMHGVGWAVKHLQPVPEFAVLLEPTAPLRTARHVDRALELLQESGADSVVAVSEVPHVLNPEELLVVDSGLLRPYVPGRTMDERKLRGAQTPAYIPNGLVYAFRIESLLKHGSLYGRKTIPMITEWGAFLDIDTADDLLWADFKFRHSPERA